jgi:hypothetical protein
MLALTIPGFWPSADDRRKRGLQGLASVLRVDIGENQASSIALAHPTQLEGHSDAPRPLKIRSSTQIIYPLLRDDLTVCERLAQQFGVARLLGHEIAVCEIRGLREIVLMLFCSACCWVLYQ